ncbi:MAG: DUF4388 domain-containing protein [Deltaproteobacteria bacterium]|nr:DUF4388 domain-containing protein [Deltaproteobacteria bacterium]
MKSSLDRRRGARIPTRLRLKIAGVDSEPRIRRGNVSMTGVYAEIDAPVGEPGSVQTLTLAPVETDVHITVLARIVRVVGVQDLWNGPAVAGIAFEFLPETEAKRVQVEDVVREIIAARDYVAQSLQIDAQFEVGPASAPESPQTAHAVVRDLGVARMVLVTSWPVTVGESIRCNIEAPDSGRRFAIAGKVTKAETAPSPDTDGYRVEVEFAPGPELAPAAPPEAQGATIAGAIGSLLEELIFPDPAGGPHRVREHLRGTLERIRLASLMGFFEIERLTGILSLRREDQTAKVFVKDGRVLDADISGLFLLPRAALATMIQWDSGDFEFELQPVDRVDRLSTSTSALLIELAKDVDEKRR